LTVRTQPRLDVSTVSVVVPTLNERETIEATVARALAAGVGEVIVADGGSTDGTVELAEGAGARVIAAQRGRGTQQNAGARAARGNALVFLHADTALPGDFPYQVLSALEQPGAAAGAFRFQLDGHGWKMRWIEGLVAVRCRLLSMPYGDQALFMSREMFERAGGFPNEPLLEDYALVRRLKKYGRIVMAEGDAVTSARRWRRMGFVRATWSNNLCLAAYKLGVSTERIERWRNAG